MSGPWDVVREEGMVYGSESSRIQEEKIGLLPVSIHPDGQQDTVILSLSPCDQLVSQDQPQPSSHLDLVGTASLTCSDSLGTKPES